MAAASINARQAPPRKRKRLAKERAPPPWPEIKDEDVDASEEDVAFFRKHGAFAGFLSKMDSSAIGQTVVGKAAKLRREDGLEASYEKRARKAEHRPGQAELVDPVDVLPVKTLEGELVLRKGRAAAVTPEERQAAVRGRPRLRANSGMEREGGEEDEEAVTGQEGAAAAPAAAGGDREASGGAGEGGLPKALSKKQKKELKKQMRKEERKKAAKGKAAGGVLDGEAGLPVEEEQKKQVLSLQRFASTEQRRTALQLRMAELGTALLADPEGKISAGLLKELLGLCEDEDDYVAGLAMLSAAAVFKDICPGYRIRPPTAKELEVTVSKEVKKLRDFESALVHSYQLFVQCLLQSAKLPPRRLPAVRSLCGLLTSLPHFNFRETILAALVPRMDAADDAISGACCEAMRELFGGTGTGVLDAATEAVQLIADLVRQRRCLLRPQVVEVFASLRFDDELMTMPEEEEDGKDKRGKKPTKGKKQSKGLIEKRKLAAKLAAEVQAELREAEAVQGVAERRRLQSATVAAVFETYFRVLKAAVNSLEGRIGHVGDGSGAAGLGSRPLLLVALAGLAKHSQFISIDFLGDLLEVLRQLARGGIPAAVEETAGVANGGDGSGGPHGGVPLTAEEQLLCCVVAFRVVRNAMDAVTTDLRDFYVGLYQLLGELPFTPSQDNSSTAAALAAALQGLLWDARQLDQSRVAAFAKRLAGHALLWPGSGEGIPALLTVRRLLQRGPRARNHLLENEGGGSVGGLTAYRPDAADPESSGALATCLWELPLLACHFHSATARLATEVAHMVTSTSDSMAAVGLTPVAAAAAYSTAEGGFRPGVQARKALPATRKVVMLHAGGSPAFKGLLEPKGFLPWMDGETIEASPVMSPRRLDDNSFVEGVFKRHFREAREFKEHWALRRRLSKLQLMAYKMHEHLRNRPRKILTTR